MIALNGVELTFNTFPNGETLVDGEEIKGLALLLRYGEHRNNKAQAELPTRQIRVAVEYPIGG